MDKIKIFTDGASRRNPGPGGFGAIVFFDNKIIELGGAEARTTNNRMELTAVIKAFELLLSVDLSPNARDFAVYTDSKYLINGITKWIYSWEIRNWTTKNQEPVLNKDLWETLLELVRNKKINWNYVKGHAGIAGNERADEIATSFADGRDPKLFSGYFSEYKIKILDLKSQNQGLKKQSKKSRSGKAYSYLSLVGGILKKHQTWEECEKRVKGKSGVRFKKAMTAEEEDEIMKDWKII